MKARLTLNLLEKRNSFLSINNFSNNLQKSFFCFEKKKNIQPFNFYLAKFKKKSSFATCKASIANKVIDAPLTTTWFTKPKANGYATVFQVCDSSRPKRTGFLDKSRAPQLVRTKFKAFCLPVHAKNNIWVNTKLTSSLVSCFSSISLPTTNSQENLNNIDKPLGIIDQKPSIANKITSKSVTSAKRLAFPFTAIIGQEEMKLALILNVIDPLIGGVMIMGDRGTGKSTTVRALVDLLPEIQVVANDAFNSDPSDPELMGPEVREKLKQLEKHDKPYSKKDELKIITQKITMVDLPLGATEDRVCGTIDIEKALTEGVKAFEPGLLAKANRGILYVDEVNLLDDHLVDVLLDSAASGWNTVEREGISISHPARFILVGSGNPEEGELRPQLLDRFGMHAQIKTVKDPIQRVQIVEQRAAFDIAPDTFKERYHETQNNLSQQIVNARTLLTKVKIDNLLRVQISQVCSALDVDGLRGDIVTNRASLALAAFEGRENVTPYDISRVISLCLRHRLRKDPLQTIDSGDLVNKAFIETFGENLC